VYQKKQNKITVVISSDKSKKEKTTVSQSPNKQGVAATTYDNQKENKHS